jgi:hypothetical protein
MGAIPMTKKVKDALVGKYFHSIKADKETIQWQGRITARVGNSYLAQLFDWICGEDSNQVLVPVADMNYWLFYDSADEMNYHHDNYRRQRAQEAR